MIGSTKNGLQGQAVVTAITSKVSTDDDTEESPLPSPNAPPAPTQQTILDDVDQKQRFSGDLKIPRHASDNSTVDDVSLSTLPELPTAYSPPPGSLFSADDDWPPSNMLHRSGTMIPPSEVKMGTDRGDRSSNSIVQSHPRILKNIANSSLDLFGKFHQNELKGHSPLEPSTQRSHASSLNDRSHVLPAVVHLKKSLEESHQAQYLLRQENNALALECDRFQEEIMKWEQHSNEMRKTAIQKEQELQEKIHTLSLQNSEFLSEQTKQMQQALEQEQHCNGKLEELKDENDKLRARIKEIEAEKLDISKIVSEERNAREKLSKELLVTKSSVSSKDEQQKTLTNQVTKLEQEVRDLRNKLKSQAGEHANKIKLKNEENEKKLFSLNKENSSQNIEILRLQAMLLETKKTEKQLAQEKEQSKQLKERVDCQEQEIAGLREENSRLKKSSNEEINKISQSTEALKAELNKLQTQLEESSCQKRELEESLEATKQSLNEYTDELARRNIEFDGMREEANRLQTELVQSLEKNAELHAENDGLRSATEVLANEISDVKSKADRAEKGLAHFQDSLRESEAKLLEYEMLTNSLQKDQYTWKAIEPELLANKENIQRRLDISPPSRKVIVENAGLAKNLENVIVTQTEVACQTDDFGIEAQNLSLDDSVFGSPDMNPIADRFIRVRDSAERAILLQEYQQELARVRKDYKKEIQFLATTHEHNLKQILHEAKMELKSRLHENKIRMHDEVQKKVAEVRAKHQAEIEKLKQQYTGAAAKAEKALQISISEISSYIKLIDEQSKERHTLQRKVDELQRQLIAEQQRSKRADDNLRNKCKQWLEETNRMIATIQEECNAVFMSKKPELPWQSSPQIDSDSDNEVTCHDSGKIEMTSASTGEMPSNTPFSVLRYRTMPPFNDVLLTMDSDYALQSPTFVNKTLDETEAFVQSLLGDDLQE